MMAMLSLLEANLMLVPKDSLDECERKVSEGLFILKGIIAHMSSQM